MRERKSTNPCFNPYITFTQPFPEKIPFQSRRTSSKGIFWVGYPVRLITTPKNMTKYQLLKRYNWLKTRIFNFSKKSKNMFVKYHFIPNLFMWQTWVNYVCGLYFWGILKIEIVIFLHPNLTDFVFRSMLIKKAESIVAISKDFNLSFQNFPIIWHMVKLVTSMLKILWKWPIFELLKDFNYDKIGWC